MARALSYYIDMWAAHLAAGLADSELVSALSGGDDFARRQRIWEMQLAANFRACGHSPARRPENQPDFRIEVGGRTVWIEAVSPTPGEQAPSGWLAEPGEGKAKTTPEMGRIRFEGGLCRFERVPPGAKVDPQDAVFEMGLGSGMFEPPFGWALSRWTGALKEKHAKGNEYRRRGVVNPGDAYVIAVDGGQLSLTPMSHGASRWPLALEASLPVGPLAFRFGHDGQSMGAENVLRFSFNNHNGADIRTEPFLREEFSTVSALVGCSPPMFAGPKLPVQVVHNPLALVSVPRGTFGKRAEEWGAAIVDEDSERFWRVERLD